MGGGVVNPQSLKGMLWIFPKIQGKGQKENRG